MAEHWLLFSQYLFASSKANIDDVISIIILVRSDEFLSTLQYLVRQELSFHRCNIAQTFVTWNRPTISINWGMLRWILCVHFVSGVRCLIVHFKGHETLSAVDILAGDLVDDHFLLYTAVKHMLWLRFGSAEWACIACSPVSLRVCDRRRLRFLVGTRPDLNIELSCIILTRVNCWQRIHVGSDAPLGSVRCRSFDVFPCEIDRVARFDRAAVIGLIQAQFVLAWDCSCGYECLTFGALL